MSDNARRTIDRRAIATRNRIADAIIRMGQKRAIDQITIAELAAAAGISRSTFYAHFASLGNYLEQSFGNMVEGHARAAARQRSDSDSLIVVGTILDHIARAPRFSGAVSRSKHRSRMFASAEARLAIVAAENLQRLRPDLGERRRSALATFAAGGFIGLLRHWMDSGLTRPAAEVEADFDSFAGSLVAKRSEVASNQRLPQQGTGQRAFAC